MTKEAVVAYVSDTHINSTVGLCPPSFNLDDGGTYHPSRPQRWLWEKWEDFWDKVKKLKGRRRLIIVFGGDLVEADTKQRSLQVVTNNKADILRMVSDVLEVPMSLNPEKAIFLRGTGAHVGKSAEYEKAVAEDYDITVKNSDGNSLWWHVRLRVNGHVFDVAHHGRMGRLPWTRGNSIHRVLNEIILRDTKYGIRLPDTIIRSHNHKAWDSWHNYDVRYIASPAFQLATEFAYRISSIEPADIGGLVFVIGKDGKILNEGEELVLYKAEPDLPTTITV